MSGVCHSQCRTSVVALNGLFLLHLGSDGTAHSSHTHHVCLGTAEVKVQVYAYGHMVGIVGHIEGGYLLPFLLALEVLGIGECQTAVCHPVVALYIFFSFIFQLRISQSVAGRVAALAKRISIVPEVCMSGGVARNGGVRSALSEKIGQPILFSPYAQLFGAIGAALYAFEKTA